jgi:hypothetical protein
LTCSKTNMFKHVILFKTKDPNSIKLICEHVMSIKNEISGLLDVYYYETLTDNAKGFNQMAIMEFNTRANFANWSNHSYHKQAVNQLKEIADTLFFDYEC